VSDTVRVTNLAFVPFGLAGSWGVALIAIDAPVGASVLAVNAAVASPVRRFA
jgi:hypothetical protein